MKPTRSMLFVPGHKQAWAKKAVAAGADAVILDLEDSVPEDMKSETRHMVAETIGELAKSNPEVGVYVRLNALETGMMGDDLEAVAIKGCNGFLPPKTYGARDVVQAEALVDHYERRNGVEAGTLEFVLSLETAQAYADCENMIKASPRCATLFAGTARDADVSRSIGFEFTPDGLETLYMRSRAVLAVRAAGRDFPIVGLWQDLQDIEGAWKFARDNKKLGFRGLVAIHPSHVAIANEVFMPTEQEVAFYQGMIDAFDAGVARGDAAVAYEGMHIDLAHVKTAREVIGMYEQLKDRG
ncbi:MAG: CoA ester lyase [Rhodobacteraceae bacterium]|jgi:citrate lyase subunit beta/citryl-CoA lyase|uniref:Citrate lyase subunit beta / citryl-CoA lyase n=1 Tax=Salipiger profundus TaxID=1229727 RepID=A0A1U7D9Y7_9RHOB|nr:MULTISPECIES: CoA ester lyase [Salipiger]APX24981.1 citrate lyase subunit beta / citryl-CoA lyase [Salipiger profundus]MAB07894.1 CoA ester lyase [Paracoccaceae bacterium]GFZ99323.1 CoA ester lyase [Salipiger profundus]SFC93303.1 citrate lyase subunit beta / citryl-CoA lyase [Salipiger profundus]